MPEQRNIKRKSTGEDAYLKWICGIAYAQGGRMCSGMEDRGNVAGKTLPEDVKARHMHQWGQGDNA